MECKTKKIKLTEKFIWITLLFPLTVTTPLITKAQTKQIASGDQVMVIVENAKIMQGTKLITKANRGDILLVTQVQKGWLGIAAKEGWIQKKQVMPISQAITFFTKNIKENPTAGDYFFRGVAFLIQKQNDKAINDFNQAIKVDPRNSSFYTNRGLARNNLNLKQQAKEDFSKAIKLNPKDASAYYNRSVLLNEMQQHDQEMKDLNASIEADNQYAPAYNNRGVLWRKHKNYTKAIADYSSAIQLDEDFSSAYTNRGYAKKMLGKFAEAKKDYFIAISLAPNDPSPRNDLAWLLATCLNKKHRDGKEAIKHAQKACDLWKNNNYNGLDTLAAAYAESGDFKKATNQIEKALRIAPESAKQNLLLKRKLYNNSKPFHE